LAVALELALDEVGAPPVARAVHDAHDAVYALAVEDPLPGADAVAAKLDALPDAAGAGGYWGLLGVVGGEHAPGRCEPEGSGQGDDLLPRPAAGPKGRRGSHRLDRERGERH